MTPPSINLLFPHYWQAQLLSARPFILPTRRYVYPAQAEEIERGALEVLISPHPPELHAQPSLGTQPFLATCALGFNDPVVPSGVWSCPNPEEICTVAGGYTYIISVTKPERFTLLELRPVLEIHPVSIPGLLIFVGHRNILAWDTAGLAWNSAKLSDEGLTVSAINDKTLHGMGWNMITDKEAPFTLDLRTGKRLA